MPNLALALKYGQTEGEKIHNPFRRLRAMGGTPRKGQLSMVAAPPGGCKTAFILFWMLNQPESVLYFSADGDKGTLGMRVYASLSRRTMEEAEKEIFQKNVTALERLATGTRHIDFCLDSSLSPETILTETESYGHGNGEWPSIIVVDNLLDVSSTGQGSDDWAGYTDTLLGLKNLATETGAAVIVLHHVTKAYADGDSEIPMSAVMNGLDKSQRLIMTIHRPGEYEIGVSVVKNSNGKAMADGTFYAPIPVDLERMQFGDTDQCQT